MEPVGSLPCPKNLVTKLYPEPFEFTPHPHILFPVRSILLLLLLLLLLFCLNKGLAISLFLSGFLTYVLYAFLTSCLRATWNRLLREAYIT
jgi:hypothetical protein